MQLDPRCHTMRIFSLDQLTVCGVRPSELVEIAARAGYGAISPFIGVGGAGGLPAVHLRAHDPDTVMMAKRLADTGVFINNADGFALYDAVPMTELRDGIALMAAMGARGIVALQLDNDDSRGFDRFCQLRDWTVEAGMTLLIEFTPLSRIPSLADALAYRKRAGGDGIAILADLLHLNQSGGLPGDLAAIVPDLIGGAQLCDGPLHCDADEYARRALYERMVPGEGDLPVRDFLAALPKDLVCGIEVPLRSRELAGEDHLARARLLLEVAQGLDDVISG